MQHFGDVPLADYRAALGLSQMDLAMLLKVSQPQLHKLERGYAQLSPEEAFELSEVFDRFLYDVHVIRTGGQPSDMPWAAAARFWASRPELSTGN